MNNPTDERFVSNYLLYLLAAASDVASAQFHERVREHGLRVPEWRVLACLVDRDGEMITRLAEFSLIEQSRLTRIIDQMVERALVLRQSDEHDKRRVRVYLTDKGRDLATMLVEKARQHEQEVLAVFKGSDATMIKSMLRNLIDGLVPGNGERL